MKLKRYWRGFPSKAARVRPHDLDRVVEISDAGGPWRRVWYPGEIYRGKTPDEHEEIPIWPDHPQR